MLIFHSDSFRLAWLLWYNLLQDSQTAVPVHIVIPDDPDPGRAVLGAGDEDALVHGEAHAVDATRVTLQNAIKLTLPFPLETTTYEKEWADESSYLC